MATPEVDDDRPSVQSLSGAVEVSGVSFRYGEDLPYVVRDLSFKVRPGEYVALVGESGCGKSTIVRLLLGFEEPEKGSIFYGPHDVRKVNLRSLRRNIGTVMQGSKVFVGNILSNLRCTRIVVAHRLSTVRDCDRILVVANGTIAEEGTYDELIARGGAFADLVARQRVALAFGEYPTLR